MKKEPKPLIGYSNVEEFLKIQRGAGRWCLLSDDFYKIMDDAEISLLSCLINIHAVKNNNSKKQGKEPTIWFRCSTRRVENKRQMGTQRQVRTLRKLKNKGLVEVRMSGNPAKRYLRVDYNTLDQLIQNAWHADIGVSKSTTHEGSRKRSGSYSLKDLLKKHPQRLVPKDNKMGMFKEYDTTKKSDPTEWDKITAKELIAFLRTNKGGKLSGPVNYKTWSKSIQLLRVQDKTPEKQITQVLKWWMLHARDQYTPVVLNAKMFRTKYGQLLAAMERSGPTLAEVSPRAIKVEQRLAGLHWPKGSKDKLAPYIQQTIDTTEHLARRLKLLTFVIDGPEYNTVRKLVTRIVETLRAHQFVEEWWRTVNRQVSNWEDWNGDLRSHSFKPDSNKVDKICEEIAHSYCQDSQQWKKLKSLLQEHIE